MKVAFYGDSLTSGSPGSSYFAILRNRLPQHTLINLGKGNDTVKSLYHRVTGQPLNGQVDLSFLWIGVNDVPWREWWGQRTFSALLRQPRTTDLGEFQAIYRATLDLLCQTTIQVVTVAPLLRGEELDNPWNQRLDALADCIEGITSTHDQADFLNLRPLLTRELSARQGSSYIPRNPLSVVADLITLRNDEQVARRSERRGLRLTLDGLHLNPSGAQLVAGEFVKIIKAYEHQRP